MEALRKEARWAPGGACWWAGTFSGVCEGRSLDSWQRGKRWHGDTELLRQVSLNLGWGPQGPARLPQMPEETGRALGTENIGGIGVEKSFRLCVAFIG